MSFVQVPPDSTGKRVYTKESTVGGNLVQTQVVHVSDSVNLENLQKIDAKGAASVRFSEGQPILDGFGMLKTTEERALAVYEGSLDSYESLFTTAVANGGILTYSAAESSEILSVTGVSGSRVVTTTNRYHYYLPGTSNSIKMTVACSDTGKANNIRRWGFYDDNDGIFFQLTGAGVGVTIRSSVSGAVVESTVLQADWNSDKLDGTGVSGHTLDVTTVNIWWLDYQWLGAGRVRLGIYSPAGERIVCHEFRNAGSFTIPYMRTGTLPVRFENENTDIAGSGSELRLVCVSVYSEGPFQEYTFWRKSSVDTSKTVSTNTELFSLRASATVNGKHNSVTIFPEILNVYTTQPIAITLWENTSVIDGTWESVTDVLEVNYSGTVNGLNTEKFKVFYVDVGASTIDLAEFFELNDEGIMINADGTYRNWAFTASKLTATDATVTVNFGHKELW